VPFELTSTAFAAGGRIPVVHTGDGRDVSPPLAWQSPSGTTQLALIVDDPDAPTPLPWVHWLLYKIPATMAGLPAGLGREAHPAQVPGSVQGHNSWGTLGYRGPAPPRGHGVHHYHIRLFALDVALDLPPGLEKAQLLHAVAGHVLAETELVGTYERH
jgi:Raf kinase inhibitor-like YbhB/YbcL family protein